MTNARVTGLRSVELGVTDLTQSAAFYAKVWGLEPVVSDGETIHLRGNATEHHAVTLRERPTASLLGVHFAAVNREAVDALHAKAKAQGVTVTAAPGDLPKSAGGGYGFQFRTPEGHILNIAADVARHQSTNNDSSVPNQALPRRAQQRQDRTADRVLHRHARLQVVRLDRHDGLRALFRRPSFHRHGARQRADA